MDLTTLFFMLASLSTVSLPMNNVESAKSNPKITVMGVVYCDICSNNTFSQHSYFLPGSNGKNIADHVTGFRTKRTIFRSITRQGIGVKIDCTFKATSPKTTERIAFSVNRRTNKYGVYKLEIPSVDGVECAREKDFVSSCKASLVSSSSTSCNIPGLNTTSDEISVKSKQTNVCFYSLTALNYRPSRKDINLCKD